jgi:hypothetical protein
MKAFPSKVKTSVRAVSMSCPESKEALERQYIFVLRPVKV